MVAGGHRKNLIRTQTVCVCVLFIMVTLTGLLGPCGQEMSSYRGMKLFFMGDKVWGDTRILTGCILYGVPAHLPASDSAGSYPAMRWCNGPPYRSRGRDKRYGYTILCFYEVQVAYRNECAVCFGLEVRVEGRLDHLLFAYLPSMIVLFFLPDTSPQL